MRSGDTGGSSIGGDEEMEEDEEREEDSTSNVVTGQGPFIVDTGNGTVREVRTSSKKKIGDVKVTEDLLSRRIKAYDFVTAERKKMLCGPSSRNTVPKINEKNAKSDV